MSDHVYYGFSPNCILLNFCTGNNIFLRKKITKLGQIDLDLDCHDGETILGVSGDYWASMHV